MTRTFRGPTLSTSFPRGELLINWAIPIAENTAPAINAKFSVLLDTMPLIYTEITGCKDMMQIA